MRTCSWAVWRASIEVKREAQQGHFALRLARNWARLGKGIKNYQFPLAPDKRAALPPPANGMPMRVEPHVNSRR